MNKWLFICLLSILVLNIDSYLHGCSFYKIQNAKSLLFNSVKSTNDLSYNHNVKDILVDNINGNQFNEKSKDIVIDSVDDDILKHRTISCLDFQIVLDILRNNTITARGSEISSYRNARSVYEANLHYSMVQDILYQLDQIPLRISMDVWSLIKSIESNGSPPEKEELAYFAETIQQIVLLKQFILDKNNNLLLYESLGHNMTLSYDLIDTFEDSFDDEFNLNADKYPVLKGLRNDVERYKIRIIQTLESMIRSEDMKEKLSDSGYVEMDGRFCLMIKNTYKKGIGVVHSSSNTGRSLYVEPFAIVEPTNEMRSTLVQIKIEENKILYDMMKCISKHINDIKRALNAVAEVDVFRAKAKLGKILNGIIPEVGNEGQIRCVNAKHPVLLLRGVNPIDNKIVLNESASALVISGPNAGGKTVILKMAGLFALMAQHSIPIPAKYGARIDLLNVMADIGDMQTVSNDLSTFSGHLIICQKILNNVKYLQSKNLHSLVLLDEIGTGTDPAQGAALAQAILEELVNLNARVIVTTHYNRIKELASKDHRFSIAAMEFIDNKPTYRLKLGYIGESYALEAGKRMNIPDYVLNRAFELLDNESKELINLTKNLEIETSKMIQLQNELNDQINDLNERESIIEENKQKLLVQINKLKENRVEEFLYELKEKEKQLEDLIQEAKENIIKIKESNQLSKEIKDKETALLNIQESIKDLRIDTEIKIVEQSSSDIGIPLPPNEPINEGTTLVILEKGSLFGTKGIVVQRNKGRGKVLLKLSGGIEIKMDRHLVGFPKITKFISQTINNNDDNLSSKEKRLLEILNNELVDPGKLINHRNIKKTKDNKIINQRSTSNTLDLRGYGDLSDAQIYTNTYLEKFLDREKSVSVIYINHGNSKTAEALKPRYRNWLKRHPLISKAYPAELTDGGDSYTVIELCDDD